MSQFDWDIDVEQLASMFVVCFDITDPDVRVLVRGSDAEIAEEIAHQFNGSECIQLIIINRDEESRGMCPYFRIITNSPTPGDRVNAHLRDFYERIGMPSLNANFDKAMVVGLYDLVEMGRCISVPSKFTMSTMKLEEMDLPNEIDSACLKPCAEKLYPEGVTLCDIAGLCVPYFIPIEAQWRIVSFLKNPLAEMVEEKVEELCHKWDVFLYSMFSQREPRIPAHIAYTYHVPTVLTTIGGATRSFLARTVPRGARNVFLN